MQNQEDKKSKTGEARRALLWRLFGPLRLYRRFFQLSSSIAFSSLTHRIVLLNLAALAVLVSGILYLNQFREGLIDARVTSLLTQGKIIAGAISAAAAADANTITINPDRLLELQAGESFTPSEDTFGLFDFPIDPERAAPILRAAISPTDTRARVYDIEGNLVVDSQQLHNHGILRFTLPSPKENKERTWRDWFSHLFDWYRRGDLPLYKELGSKDGRDYPEVALALDGSPGTIVRVNDQGRLIVSVAVPIQRSRSIAGALLLSTRDGDIDKIVEAERWGIVRVFLVAALVTSTLSILLAGTIAGPMRKLSEAAERVKRGVKAREQIPDFSERSDEIGQLSRSLRAMTETLYQRMDAIEAFAADVSHELKNPLTSLRSAVETLPLAKEQSSRARLVEIILHDVRRLDRLISDISDASRLDAELARQDSEPLDMYALLETICSIQDEIGAKNDVKVIMEVDGKIINIRLGSQEKGKKGDAKGYWINGNDSRLGQVFVNLIDNARSFSAKGGQVRVNLSRDNHWITILVDDDGPGIQAEDVNRVFERFYTDRPSGEDFGQNSGLGLSISKQIIEAYQGEIHASNRMDDTAPETGKKNVLGARFTVRLPAVQHPVPTKTAHTKKADQPKG